jgi:hypothetical protein
MLTLRAVDLCESAIVCLFRAAGVALVHQLLTICGEREMSAQSTSPGFANRTGVKREKPPIMPSSATLSPHTICFHPPSLRIKGRHCVEGNDAALELMLCHPLRGEGVSREFSMCGRAVIIARCVAGSCVADMCLGGDLQAYRRRWQRRGAHTWSTPAFP